MATLGDGLSDQRYDKAQLDLIVARVRPLVQGAEAGKVFCTWCRHREARWRRHFEDGDAGLVHLFVYCTQCHKTGIADFRTDGPPPPLRQRIREWIARLLH